MIYTIIHSTYDLSPSLFLKAYLDEINTASCLGLFKEIIVDRTINGKVREAIVEVLLSMTCAIT